MESNGYVFWISLLLGILCAQTIEFVLSLIIHYRNWYEAMNDAIAPISSVLIFAAYIAAAVLYSYFGKQIGQIPFGWQIATICVVGLIDFVECITIVLLFENYTFIRDSSSGGGVGGTDFHDDY